MKLSARIFVFFFLLVGVGLYTFFSEAAKQLRPVMRQASENVLVDTANLLAEIISVEIDKENISNIEFVTASKAYQNRQLNAAIWGVQKTKPDFIIYITDSTGKVIYHSDPAEVGKDYSRWLDVSRTLKGEYGARTTRKILDDELSGIMYVAAPIYAKGKLMGVLTVGQPNTSAAPFMDFAKAQLMQKGTIILILALVIGASFSYWITSSIRKLSKYVQAVRRGERVNVPKLNEKELASLAEATESMRQELEGKNYVENYVHTLTHEMKSPIAAIRGASELLLEGKMTADEQQKFLQNIVVASHRMQEFIDRVLSLASIENTRQLTELEYVDLEKILKEEITEKDARCHGKNIVIHLNSPQAWAPLKANAFLLKQAVNNLLENAIDFSYSNSTIKIDVNPQNGFYEIVIQNQGDWIPDYALPRIFDRFYSLARPDGRSKSSGLGLNFVQEIAALHKGTVQILNAGEKAQQRVRAVLSIPA